MQGEQQVGETPVQSDAVRPDKRRLARAAQRRAAARRRQQGRLLRWSAIVAGIAAIIVGAYLYWVAAPGATSTAGARAITLGAGSPAPDFVLPSTAGHQVRLSDYRSRQNVLLFFQEGVMCPPCWQQMRDLQADSAKLDALNVALVTITVDPLPMLVEAAAREQVAGTTLLYDKDAQVARAYQALTVSMHPGQRPGHTFVLVDTAGTIRWRHDFQEMYVPNERVLAPVATALEGQR